MTDSRLHGPPISRSTAARAGLVSAARVSNGVLKVADGREVVLLPHSSAPAGGTTVGKVVDECSECTHLTADRYRAWRTGDWALEERARIAFLQHWRKVHRAYR